MLRIKHISHRNNNHSVKYLRRFNEGESNVRSFSDSEDILDIFNYEVADNIDITMVGPRSVGGGDRWCYELVYTDSEDYDGGKSGKSWNSDNIIFFESIVINVWCKDESIVEYLNNFFNHVVSQGYLCNAWTPVQNFGSNCTYRFHISTKESDPNIKTLNDLTPIRKKALDWWDSLTRKESEDIERKYGYYGHDIGSTETDIEYFYNEERIDKDRCS